MEQYHSLVQIKTELVLLLPYFCISRVWKRKAFAIMNHLSITGNLICDGHLTE